MGSFNSGKGLQTGVSYPSTFNQIGEIYNTSKESTSCVVGRNSGNVTERSNRKGRSSDSGVLLDFLSGPQKGRRTETGFESERSQPFYQCENIQNADSSVNSVISQKRGLVGLDRSERRVFSRSDLSGSQKVSSFRVSRRSLSVQGAAFRPLDRTKSVYKGVSPGDRSTTSSGYTHLSLFRRLSHSSKIRAIAKRVSSSLRRSIEDGGICNKSKEIPLVAMSDFKVSGHGVEYKSRCSLSATGQGASIDSMCHNVQESRSVLASQTIPSSSRLDGVDVDDGSISPIVYETSPAVSEFSVGCEVSRFRLQNHDSTETLSDSVLVDGQNQSVERFALDSQDSISGVDNRCLQVGLGGSSSGLQSSRQVEHRPEKATHKLPRVACSSQRTQSVQSFGCRQGSPGQNGQHDYPHVYKQTRGYQVPRNVSFDLGLDHLVYPEKHRSQSDACVRDSQYSGGSPFSSYGVSAGMGIEQFHSSPIVQPVGNSGNRSFCERTEQEASSVLFSSISSSGSPDRCSSVVMEEPVSLCVSTSVDNQSSASEGGSRGDNFDFDSSQMDQERVVSPSPGSVDRLSLSTPVVEGHSVSGSRLSASSQPSRIISNRLVGERNTYIAKGLSRAAAETCMASRRTSTRRNYNSGWNHFSSWCEGQNVDPHETTVNLIIEYLQFLLSSGKSYNTIKSRVSAIAACHEGNTFSGQLAQNRLIKIFLRGAFEKNPPVKDKLPSWDLPSVLDAMMVSPFEPIQSLEMDMLTLKTVFLVAVCSARRLGELKALDCRPPFCSIGDGGVVLRTHSSFLPKVPSVENIERTLEFALYGLDDNGNETELAALCICRALKAYLAATKDIRTCSQLFVTYKRGAAGRPASKVTIARWLKKAIELAYEYKGLQLPMGVKAHSTRAISASWAEINVSNVLDICLQASWATPHTFIKHYKLDLSNSVSTRHAAAVLQAHASV